MRKMDLVLFIFHSSIIDKMEVIVNYLLSIDLLKKFISYLYDDFCFIRSVILISTLP